MSNDLSKYVTAQQAANMLGVDDSNIRHLLLGGRIKGKKLGHVWIVYVPSIEKYNETKSTKGRPRSREPQLQEAS